MSEHEFGRFTVRGGPQVEADITAAMVLVRERCRAAFAEFPIEAVLMLGGYGRGEGGVVTVDGRERPHNNFDFLVVTRSLGRATAFALHARARATFDTLAGECDLLIDYAVTTDRKLALSPCLVMWYDMRFGHKVILGPADYMARFTHFTAENVLPADVTALLVNRGTLFAINRLLLRQKPMTDRADRRLFVKHMMKALIGYGDALLYFLGDYHWSYVEKGRRMHQRTDVPADVKAWYLEALDFRFAPRYEDFEDRDPARWLDETLAGCELVHLACERARLGLPGLEWGDYQQALYGAALHDHGGSLRGVARMVRNGLALPACPVSAFGWRERLGYRAAGPRGVLLASFPAVVYPGAARAMGVTAALLLRDRGDDLLVPFLRWWSRAGDTNFLRGIRSMGLTLDETKEADRDLPDRRLASPVPQNA